jgi:predicted peptidase
MEKPSSESPRRSRACSHGLEILLGLSMASLVAQIAWPSLDAYFNRPAPGRPGSIDNPVAATTHSLAAKCFVSLPTDHGLTSRRDPLILYLHGAGERGNDIRLVTEHGLPAAVCRGRELPFVVLAPQCREGVSWSPDDLENLLKAFSKIFPVDSRRIFVAGYSMGGFGAWQLASRMPDRLAGVVSIAGAQVPSKPESLTNVPIWAFHGDRDQVVDLAVTQQSVDAVRKAGGTPKMTVLHDAGHGIERQVLESEQLFAWMVKQPASPESID